jgi:hypothetical protein
LNPVFFNGCVIGDFRLVFPTCLLHRGDVLIDCRCPRGELAVLTMSCDGTIGVGGRLRDARFLQPRLEAAMRKNGLRGLKAFPNVGGEVDGLPKPTLELGFKRADWDTLRGLRLQTLNSIMMKFPDLAPLAGMPLEMLNVWCWGARTCRCCGECRCGR